MSQLGETVAMAAFSELDKTCPMEPHKKKKTLTGKAFKVKSVPDLRKAMVEGKSTRQWKQNGDDFEETEHFDADKKPLPEYDEEPIEIKNNKGEEKKYPLSIAAHHLIPGEASLPKSDLAKYIWKKKKVIDGDIGYDVDGAENGKWLPTHHKMSLGMGKKQTIIIRDKKINPKGKGLSWKKISEITKKRMSALDAATYSELFLLKYSQQAMALLNCQFHDSHPNYSEWVKLRLNQISVVIDTLSGSCVKCKKNKKKTPPYLLVYRLNMLSKLCDTLLSGKPRKSWLNIYTSYLSKSFFSEPIPADKLK